MMWPQPTLVFHRNLNLSVSRHMKRKGKVIRGPLGNSENSERAHSSVSCSNVASSSAAYFERKVFLTLCVYQIDMCGCDYGGGGGGGTDLGARPRST